MKNVLVIINEKGTSSLSFFPLLDELPANFAEKLSLIFLDEAISEGFPVDKGYSIFLVNFNQKDMEEMGKRYNNFVKPIAVKGKSYPELIKNTVKAIGDFDKYLFVKSNIIPYTEPQLKDFFSRLNVHDIVFGSFDEEDFYIIGFIKEILKEITSLKEISEGSIEELSLEKRLDVYYLPEKAIANSVESLTELRNKLPHSSGLARKIDNLILELTKYHGDDIEKL